MPASVHSLANATRKPNENIDAVIRHYKAINDELEAQLAIALSQRDAWRELVEHCWRLVDAERKRWFRASRPRSHHAGTSPVTSRSIMPTEQLTYAQIAERLSVSTEAARALVKRHRVPRSRSNDGKTLAAIDLQRADHMVTIQDPV
jgi:hypothetical protein